MRDYSPDVTMKSLDVGVVDFQGTPHSGLEDLTRIGREIKGRVRAEIGDWTRRNVGIGTNRFLAKVAAGLHKPDGLDAVWWRNLAEVYSALELEDLTGIASRFGARLRACGINTPLEFLGASEDVLRKLVFRGIWGLHWYRRLRGYEVDVYKTRMGMVGRQWVVGRQTNDGEFLRSCLHYLTETVGMKLRSKGRGARGVCVWMYDNERGRFREKRMYDSACYTDAEIWRRVEELFERRPAWFKPKIMGVYLYQLESSTRDQLSLLSDAVRVDDLTLAVDGLNDRYGIFTVHAAESLEGTRNIKQKIPFGGTEYFDLLLKRR
jgi:DNA polymerase-4